MHPECNSALWPGGLTSSGVLPAAIEVKSTISLQTYNHIENWPKVFFTCLGLIHCKRTNGTKMPSDIGEDPWRGAGARPEVDGGGLEGLRDDGLPGDQPAAHRPAHQVTAAPGGGQGSLPTLLPAYLGRSSCSRSSVFFFSRK